MKIKVVKWPGEEGNSLVDLFIKRPAFDEVAESTARDVLAEIMSGGDKAILKFAKKFDNVSLKATELMVQDADILEAGRSIAGDIRSAVMESHRRVTAFAKNGLKKDWSMATPRGGALGEKFIPFDRVGVYVPGGSSPLASSAIMTATLAKVAGVREIVACTPCGKDKKVSPVLLHALKTAGATEIYRVGGIQAIGMMAYGTKTVRKVQKIVGPGNAYVTAAKRQVYGFVSLDLVAGPSEIAILADNHADPRFVAADLLSQAEHGTGMEKTMLVTDSMKLAEAVRDELVKQVADLSRKDMAMKVLDEGTLLVVVRTIDEGIDLCNSFAPEHFEIIVQEPMRWLSKVKSAGAVFLGKWTPEVVGDYVAGPSHVLPTGGSAKMFSGLTVDDFRRRSSFISFTKADLMDTIGVIETFGSVEGLDGHTRSARIRFE